jgi:hypothetical protein
MNCRSLALVIAFIVLPLHYVSAQDSIRLPEIKGSHSQEYQELQIEITTIKRMKTYQPYWYKSERLRGNKITAKPGFEIALVYIQTTRLGRNRGIKINQLYLYDSNAKRYEGDLTSIYFIGSRSEAESEPKEQSYEFPVIVPEGVRFSAVQLQQFTTSNTQPFFVFQDLIFDVSKFNW